MGKPLTKYSKTLIVVVGSTAVGKTGFCVKLAQHFNTEIVNADSRQFYKELSIGTAKPSTEEMKGIPHHFVNNFSITIDYNAGKYENDALFCLDKLFKSNNNIILTGGSGLFIKAVCEGLDEMPVINPKLRNELNNLFKKEGIALLQEELKKKDPEYYHVVDINNHARVIRALEIIRTSNKPFSSFRQQKSKDRPFNIIKIGLHRNREELYKRINQRMDSMLNIGLLEEVKSVIAYKNFNALKTVGYKEIFDFLEGKYNWEETIRLLKQNSRRYAKGQMTWFNKDKEIKWFHPDEVDKVIHFIDKKIFH